MLPRAFGLRAAAPLLRYWQLLLAAGLSLPLLWQLRPLPPPPLAFSELGWVLSGGVNALGRAEVGPWPLAATVLAAVLAGIGLRTLLVARAAMALRSIVREARELEPTCAAVERARRLVPSRPQARILVSATVPTPFTGGWPRPVVVLPQTFTELDEEGQVAVLCHELLHVARRDWPQAVVEQAVRCLLWFHPAVHAVVARLDTARERTVDLEVVALVGRRVPYLRALLFFAAAARSGAVPALVQLFPRNNVKERVRALSEEASMSRARLVSTLVLSGSLLSAAAIAAATLVAPAPTQEEESGETIHFVTGDVIRPEKVFAPIPQYTEAARKERTEGIVVLQTVIEKDGGISSVDVLEGLPNGLTESAVSTIEQWTFEPATLDGEPVRVRFNLTINFRLDHDK